MEMEWNKIEHLLRYQVKRQQLLPFYLIMGIVLVSS